jgi:hypothetical protein
MNDGTDRMTQGRRLASGLVVAVAAVLATTGTAAAGGPFYASPTGLGTNCTDVSPCSIYEAKDQANVGTFGESVLLEPGTYTLTTAAGGDIFLTDGTILAPAVAGTRPEIASTEGHDLVVNTGSTGGTIQDLRLNISGLGGANRALDLQVAGALAERVEVIASGPAPIGALVKNGATLRDSTVRVPGDGTAVASGGSGGTVRNVTAIASGAASLGLSSYASFGAPQTVTVENSILRGGQFDIQADGLTGDNVVVNVSYSDFVTTDEDGPGKADIVPDAGNITDAPLLVSGTDLHELAASPTVDKGQNVSGLGSLDIDGETRIFGPAPDMGGDEYVPPAPSTPATSTPAAAPLASTPVKKCKKKHKRSALAAKKKCKRKK